MCRAWFTKKLTILSVLRIRCLAEVMESEHSVDLRYGVDEYRYFFTVYAENIDGDFRTRIRFSTGHEAVVDEPVEFGGSNAGPNPIEMLLASLASCFVISILIHAKRFGVSIDRVEVYVRGWFDIRGFLGIDSSKRGMELITLRARIESGAECEKLKKVVDRALRGWVVGSTLAKSGVLKISLSIPRCVDSLSIDLS
ncbi:MAG TPA: OsmC family peroxiredoxin [Ignisphaera aggregans]|uniref:OsmC family peroxiredoxin n=1 Tax=Ignisphaera aggregans TaxID=334771 RepID=A0A832YSQ6_9CREN|nr:OsmC family peroxiredoxin [Ignisphaera aggregans]